MKYSIIKEDLVYDDFFKIKKATILHDTFNSDSQIEVIRQNFDRGSAIAIVLVEKDTDSILLINQFRYPTATHVGYDGWLIEIVAGCMEEGEDPMECARREVEEEIGYQVKKMELIGEYFSSPGGSSEKVNAFYAEVNSTDKKFEGGGLKSEQEDIQLIKLPISEIKQKLNANFFKDAKTIIALQWLLLHKF
ncbi:NUDIX hydrolase [Formosa sediminum]|uniref:GDP-mannose pyrophosphatase n=1 Tax=Formosa sediminum TaxID=2594004 RepID=A0A516GU56_9FLAO|nr:NUDIX hydrolase [Formosa sediminum]QDO95047.1 NUDIX hydrolase [Formosa sediminum]